MIDMPPQQPIQQERVIELRLIDCGLDTKRFTVKYEDYLQSIEIVIDRDARASESQFACIHRAADYENVIFEEPTLRLAYADFTRELYRPQMIADATANLKKLGILDRFPKRTSAENLEEYARALESHCGLTPGSALKVSGEGILFDSPHEANFQVFSKKYSKFLAAIRYASAIGDLKDFGFIGNEAITGTVEQ